MLSVLRSVPTSVACADSAMLSSHGTVTEDPSNELKTKGWQIGRSGPTTWTTQHEQRAVDPPRVIKQKEHGCAHTESEQPQGKTRCVRALRCGEGGTQTPKRAM